RPEGKSFIVLLDADYKLEQYVSQVPPVAYDLIELAEKPLTIIFDGARRLATGVINQDGSVVIRVVQPLCFCKRLLEKFRKPLVSTSANLSGRPAPVNRQEIPSDLIDQVDYAIPASEASTADSKPSTIIRLGPSGEYTLIRKETDRISARFLIFARMQHQHRNPGFTLFADAAAKTVQEDYVIGGFVRDLFH